MLGARIGVLALALSSAACINPRPDPWDAPLPGDAYPVTVRQTRSMVEIPVQADRRELSYVDRAALENLGAEYLAAGHGPIVIALPLGGGNDEAAVAVDAKARTLLYEMGVAYRMIQGTAYDAAGIPDAPLVVMVDRYVAEAPECHQRWLNAGYTFHGDNTLNFGCATQANLAAVVTDPADLLGPRTQDPADAVRRSVLLTRYRAGETTVTTRDAREGVSVSDAVE
jgi:pilus assembly protein CpaD